MQEAPWMQTNISSMTFRFTEVCLLESTVPWSWLSRLRSKHSTLRPTPQDTVNMTRCNITTLSSMFWDVPDRLEVGLGLDLR